MVLVAGMVSAVHPGSGEKCLENKRDQHRQELQGISAG